MEKIRDKQGLTDVPRPCDQFDLIGGTSTGGLGRWIIAIMLGRLRMTIDECIKEYRDFARQAFTAKSTLKSKVKIASIFTPRLASDASISVLSGVLCHGPRECHEVIIKEFFVEEQCKRRRDQGESTAETCPHEGMPFQDRTCTKAVVLAIAKDNVGAARTLFKTYD
ncbi:hypothetical protein VTN49DRAFT_2014 [Thermomyces lanuginosus]|uniref:uncharacterized protein n=1 Tax=Thermomyces lanuginosus TaxID=5541 RepID=UPI003742A6FD